MAVTGVGQQVKSVADPNALYESMLPLWTKSRAVIGGERFVKEYDGVIDVNSFTNLLIPFSPSMSDRQYKFFKAEAELPGVTSQYARTVIGGLLRKQPQVKLPEGLPEGAYDWILSEFCHNGSPLVSFLDEVLWEEMRTSRAWVYVDFPKIENPQDLTREEMQAICPYPVIWRAESVVNWRVATDPVTGVQKLQQIIYRTYEETYDDQNEFHPKYLDTVYVHELVEGRYQIRKFQIRTENTQVMVVNGQLQQQYTAVGSSGKNTKTSAYELVDTITDILKGGEPLDFIPAWPVNGSVHIQEPILMPFIDKEVALYNKISRRNHLMYGASTFTPVISSNMSDDEFDKIVNAGLGSWIKLQHGDTATVLDTPTGPLADMDRAIAAGFEEMARLGVRMLAAETAQSGVALDIRNAGQTAQLGTLNTKIGNQFASIIAFMVNWRFGTDIKASDVGFELSADFNPTPLGSDWLRLATEWYEKGLIPRSVWLLLLKQNDMVGADYDDEVGKVEITNDDLVFTTKENTDLVLQQQRDQAALMAGSMGAPDGYQT